MFKTQSRKKIGFGSKLYWSLFIFVQSRASQWEMEKNFFLPNLTKYISKESLQKMLSIRGRFTNLFLILTEL